MTIAVNDLGVLSHLAIALGIFTPAGDPNPNWFGNPEASLKRVLANNANALPSSRLLMRRWVAQIAAPTDGCGVVAAGTPHQS